MPDESLPRALLDSNFKLNIPSHPIIPFIIGDGIGVDITPSMHAVIDNTLKKAYGETKKIEWMEVYAGERATELYGKDTWLPDETLNALKKYILSIKGPLATPIGGGIRSLNDVKSLVALGVERVIFSFTVFSNPSLIKDAVSCVGSQSVAVVLNYKIATDLFGNKTRKVFINRGSKKIGDN